MPRRLPGVSGGVRTWSAGAGIVGGIGSAGVTTEFRNGSTVQYRDDASALIPVTVNDAGVTALQVAVWHPQVTSVG